MRPPDGDKKGKENTIVCLAIPGKIVELDSQNANLAVVDVVACGVKSIWDSCRMNRPCRVTGCSSMWDLQ